MPALCPDRLSQEFPRSVLYDIMAEALSRPRRIVAGNNSNGSLVSPDDTVTMSIMPGGSATGEALILPSLQVIDPIEAFEEKDAEING